VTGDFIGRTAFAAEGDGPTVVLIHGLGLARGMWDGQVAALSRRFRTLRYDLLGHGESARPRGAFEMLHFVAQLDELLDGLALDRCALVGFSLGGMIARAYAIARPDRVGALIVLNSPHGRTEAERAAVRARAEQAATDGPGATVEAALERWFTAGFAAAQPEVLERVRCAILANDPEVYPHAYRVLAEGDAALVEPIAEIRCPTLVLACEDDRGNSPAMAQAMAATIPGAKVEIVPGLRHMGLVEDPGAINALIVPFLDEALRAKP
jgi:(E)-2-((N-methylformamido)methylene)succinate hydrolase